MSSEKSNGEDESDKQAESLKSQIFWYKWGAGALVVFAIAMFLAGLNIYAGGGLNANELGDFWSGGIGPLLSFAALIILYVAFRGQQQELELQREELKATREELAGQRRQLALQNQQTEQQIFENTFFQLIRLHHTIVERLYFRDEDARRAARIQRRFGDKAASGRDKVVSGRACFPVLFELFTGQYSAHEKTQIKKALIERGELEEEADSAERNAKVNKATPQWSIETEREVLNYAFQVFWKDHRADLQHYFQNLLEVVRHIAAHVNAPRLDFTRMLVAQLSTHEVLLLTYYCISDEVSPELTQHVVDYGILRNVPRHMLLKSSHLDLVGRNS